MNQLIFWFNKKCTSPIRPVRGCTSIALYPCRLSSHPVNRLTEAGQIENSDQGLAETDCQRMWQNIYNSIRCRLAKMASSGLGLRCSWKNILARTQAALGLKYCCLGSDRIVVVLFRSNQGFFSCHMVNKVCFFSLPLVSSKVLYYQMLARSLLDTFVFHTSITRIILCLFLF